MDIELVVVTLWDHMHLISILIGNVVPSRQYRRLQHRVAGSNKEDMETNLSKIVRSGSTTTRRSQRDHRWQILRYLPYTRLFQKVSKIYSFICY